MNKFALKTLFVLYIALYFAIVGGLSIASIAVVGNAVNTLGAWVFNSPYWATSHWLVMIVVFLGMVTPICGFFSYLLAKTYITKVGGLLNRLTDSRAFAY